jgi:hypothetical protein
MRLVTVSLILVATASAQQFDSSEWKVNETGGTAVFGPPHAAPILIGEPYSADEVQEHTPPDGASGRTSAVIGHAARDYQGRTRTEQGYKWPPVSLTEIIDPVAGVAYLLDDQKKVAHRMLLAPALTANPPPTEDSGTTIESLGNQTIQGVIAEGVRKISRDLIIESWESRELKITLLVKSSNGYSTMLTNLSREPDPALFLPPPAYAVVDEKDPFPMTVQFQ